MKRLSVAGVTAALNKFRGNIRAVADAFEVTRGAVYNYIQRHPGLDLVLKDSRESMRDDVQSRFFLDCIKDHPAYQTSRIFFLKTQCGWRETIEHVGRGGGPFELALVEKIVDAPAKDDRVTPRAG